jgi:hypothetical protein
MSYKYFTVDMPRQKVADILSVAISPQRFYHHDRQGGIDWRVDTILSANGQTKITLHDDVDDSVISYLLLKQ